MDNERTGTGQQEDLFRLLVESVRDYAIFMLDPEGRVTTWNPGAQNIKGYTEDEILGTHFSVFYPPDAVARNWPQLELELARERGRFEDEGWRVRKDGSRFWANVVIAPVWDRAKRLRGFAKVTRDLTARRQIEELQRSQRQVNEFLAMLAHELRNPLAPLQSALDVLERKPDEPAVAHWALPLMRRQVRQLARLVDDLLDVSRITRGKIDLKPQLIDLRRSIELSVDAIRPMVRARGHVIDVALPATPLPIRVDPVRLEQILANVLGNAIKYTPAGGRISIRASRIDEFATVTVVDNGIGMAPDLVARVFDLFAQGHRGLDRRDGGLGVGLTLAKHLAELSGGTLTAASPGVGQGSEFTLALPLVAAAERTVQGDDPVPRFTAERPCRILIVDDNRDAAEALGALLQILGQDATIVHDGFEALAVATESKPDLVLLDLGLPGIDGVEVARRMREIPELRATRLIACTGYGSGNDDASIYDAGFEQRLVKPVTVADLQQILAT
ncbi:MAG: ATP-binding protein [Rudaea sp.]